jgi:outer membrane biosynthesis protein TonB
MKLPAKYAAVLLPLLLSGCTHKNNQAQVQQPALAPPIVDAPPPPEPTQPTDLPPPVVTPPKPATDANANNPPPPPPPKPKHKKPVQKPADQPASATTTQQASNAAEGGKPVESAIGQLSTGDPADVRTETEDSIAATEKSLRALGRKLSDQEEKTAEQITEFLKEAKKALTTGDVEGAQTLAAKAKVLLGELTQ